MPALFHWEHVVRDDEIDPQGHANNVEYVKWMQSAAVAHSSAQGWTPERYLEIGAGWVARRHTIEYLLPVFAGERLTVRTWVAGFRKVTSVRRYEIMRPESDGEESLLATAETHWAFIDLQRQRPKRIPPEVSSAFEIWEAKDNS